MSRRKMALTGNSKGERRFLAKYHCGFCEHPMDRDGCSAIWEKCSLVDQVRRREKCLMNYKPRPKREAVA